MDQKPSDRELGLSLLGKIVVFRHRPADVSPAMVISCDKHGIVELMGWSGKFSPDLFEIATEPEIARRVNEA